MREWVRYVYFSSTNQFLDSKMLESSNNMTPQRGDKEIITQLRIMNQRMDKMANEFEDIQCANDHGGIQNRLE